MTDPKQIAENAALTARLTEREAQVERLLAMQVDADVERDRLAAELAAANGVWRANLALIAERDRLAAVKVDELRAELAEARAKLVLVQTALMKADEGMNWMGLWPKGGTDDRA